jgi:hypothetical protein
MNARGSEIIGQERRSSMKRYLVVLLAAGAVVFAKPALAHHSFSATYLETQSIDDRR